MIFRGFLQHIRFLWQNVRGTVQEQTSLEKKMRLQFEFATWAFVIGFACLVGGLGIYVARMGDLETYITAFALPGGVRAVLFIPMLLILDLPAIVVPAVKLWRPTRAVFGRFYLLLQVVFSLGMIGFIGYLELLVAWI